MGHMKPSASLVMATLGRVTEIERCVNSLAAQTRRDFELIVVDQNHDDRLIPVLDRARALGLECHHLRQKEPNQCKARNAGTEYAQGKVVAYPDDDCWYEPNVIEQVMSRFEQQPALDGLVIRWQETGPAIAGRIQFNEFARFRGPTASCITLFFCIRKVREVGGFDQALGLHSWYGACEETDLMFRLLGTGAIMEVEPRALVHHRVGYPNGQPAAKAFASTRKRARGTGALYARHSLSAWVILRGLLSPWVRVFRFSFIPAQAAHHAGAGLGRLEGFLGWHLGHRSSPQLIND